MQKLVDLKMITTLAYKTLKYPAIKKFAMFMLRTFPMLQRYIPNKNNIKIKNINNKINQDHLSAPAKEIFSKLKSEISRVKNENNT